MRHEAVSILLQAAGVAQGSMEDQPMPQAEQEGHQPAAMPAQMPEGGLHTAPGMQPQGQPSSFGMAEAGRGGAPQPTAAEQGVAGRDGEAEMREANPFRSGSGPSICCSLSSMGLPAQLPYTTKSVLQVHLSKVVQRPCLWQPRS